MKMTKTRKLVECSILIAIASVLSMLKIMDLPYGGSVTIASMLPLVIVAFRHGIGWGLGSSLVYGIVQQLLGLKTLSYFTTWQSIIAVIALDYIVAFTVIGLAGVFRKIKNQSVALVSGTMLVCVLRYMCHVLSGATVWAGVSIPEPAALIYSFIYNATYMVPETLVTVIAAFYIGYVVDLRKDQPTRLAKTESAFPSFVKVGSGLAISAMLVYDIVSVFSKLQNAETGEFYFEGINDVNWVSIIVISSICIIATAIMLIYGIVVKNKKKSQNTQD